MECCRQFVQDAMPHEFYPGQMGRSQCNASKGPSYPVELADKRFIIPSSSSLERPISPSESVSEESGSMHSEESNTEDDEDWQKSDGIAQRIISMIVKIFDDQKKASQLEGQQGKVRMASGGGGGQAQQPEQPEQQEEAQDQEIEEHGNDEVQEIDPPDPAQQHHSSGSSDDSNADPREHPDRDLLDWGAARVRRRRRRVGAGRQRRGAQPVDRIARARARRQAARRRAARRNRVRAPAQQAAPVAPVPEPAVIDRFEMQIMVFVQPLPVAERVQRLAPPGQRIRYYHIDAYLWPDDAPHPLFAAENQFGVPFPPPPVRVERPLEGLRPIWRAPIPQAQQPAAGRDQELEPVPQPVPVVQAHQPAERRHQTPPREPDND